jgi:VanZ family protein
MMALIFLASNTPGRDLPHFGYSDLVAKKGGHVVGYALLALAYLYAIGPRGLIAPRAAWIAVTLATVFALSDEIHQVFIPGRSAAAGDVMIDAAGAILGVGLRLLRQRRRAALGAPPLA